MVGVATQAWAQGKCELIQIAEWPVRLDQQWPVVDGSINGKKIGVLLDTGASVSIVARSAAVALGLKTSAASTNLRLFGVGGETRLETAYIDEFKIGDAARKDWQTLVAGELRFPGDVAFLLGRDFFQDLNIEFDLPHNVVRLFETKECGRTWLAYWAKDAIEVPLESGGKIQLPVKINGKRLLAELDSGAAFSTLSLEGAMQAGVNPKSPGVLMGGCAGGIGGVRAQEWIAPFDSFAVGDEVIRNPRIRIADLYLHVRSEETGSNLRRRLPDLADIFLGDDFLRSHRVLVARSQGKIYLSYAGGPVFRSAGGKPCPEGK